MHVAQDLIPFLDPSPQPVALALGRIVRAMGAAEKLDGCIKAAEVAARYLAAASLASAAVGPEEDATPLVVDNFVGNLSFGVFEKAARAAYGVGWDHPLRDQLRNCLKSTKRQVGLAGQRLEEFVRLRNELGHAITPADEARARLVMERDDPIGGLIELLDSAGDILLLPLLVVLSQQHRRGRLLSHVAFFAGEGEPIPQEIELRDPIFEWETPYICTPAGLLPLEPGVVYAPKASDGRMGLHLLDGIDEDALRYKSAQDGAIILRADGVAELATWVKLPFAVGDAARKPTIEPVSCLDGRTLHGYLSGEAAASVETAEAAVGPTTSLSKDLQDATSLRDVEAEANRLGLGAAYRDILYALSAGATQAELAGGGVRVVTKTEPSRALATIELTTKPSLLVVLFDTAPGAEKIEETETHEVQPGEAVDGLVARIHAVMSPAP